MKATKKQKKTKPQTRDQLYNNTLSTTDRDIDYGDGPPRSVCWNKKVCKRLKTCEYCLNRRLGLLGDLPNVHPHLFREFTTISNNESGAADFASAIELAARLRKLSKGNLSRRTGSYILFAAVGKNFTPHLHLISEMWDADKDSNWIRSAAEREGLCKAKNLFVVSKSIYNPQGLINYMIGLENYQGAIQSSPKGYKLITTSRDISLTERMSKINESNGVQND